MTCPRGKLVKKLVKEIPGDNVVILREARSITEARGDLLQSLKQYCVAKCGGCPLTEEDTDA